MIDILMKNSTLIGFIFLAIGFAVDQPASWSALFFIVLGGRYESYDNDA